MTTEYFPLRQLTDKFYDENGHLERVLDKTKGSTEFTDKGRGYGVIVIDLNGLKFGIPLRSRMTHNFGFTTSRVRDEASGRTIRKGLDFTKAVILKEDDYVTDRSFKIPSDEFDKINDAQETIKRQFTKFVEKYITAIEKNDRNLLGKNYRDTTLINYHEELGIPALVEVSSEG